MTINFINAGMLGLAQQRPQTQSNATVALPSLGASDAEQARANADHRTNPMAESAAVRLPRENGNADSTKARESRREAKAQAGQGEALERARQLRELEARDREVRAHEQAHLSAAGSLATGGASFETTRGPDGRQYAVGGEVQLDTSPVPGDPQATVRKAQQIRRAALAPADPSPQDRQVAAQASAMEQRARSELAGEGPEDGIVEDGASVKAAETSATEPAEEGGGRTDEIRASCPQCGGRHTGHDHSEFNKQRILGTISAAGLIAGEAAQGGGQISLFS